MTGREFAARAYADMPGAVYDMYAAGQITDADLTPAQRRHMELYRLYYGCYIDVVRRFFDPDSAEDIEGKITALQALAGGASLEESGVEQYLDTPDRHDDELHHTLWD